MDAFDDLDPSLYHNPSTTPDEVRKVTIMLPPGAAPTYTTPSSFHLQVGSGLPFLSPTGHYPDTDRVHTPFSTDSPSDGSETSPYDPGRSAHDSTSLTPRAPHPHNSRRNVPQSSHLSPPPTHPGTRNNQFPSYPTSAHPQPWPHPHLMSMSPAVQHSEGGSVGVGPSTSPRQLNPTVPVLSSWVAQPVQLTVSNPGYLGPSFDSRQVPGPAPSRAKRRISEVGPLDVQHTQVGFLNQHALENYPTPDAYRPYSWSNSPPTNSTAQFPADVPADMMPGPSPLAHRGSDVSVHSEESFQLSPSSGLQDDLDNNAAFPSTYASPGAPSLASHALPHQGTSSAVPRPPGKKRRSGQRKRVPNPKDPKAAERLRNQRESDDEHIEDILTLLVPDNERDGPKKGRLRLIARHVRKLVESRSDSVQDSVTIEQRLDPREPSTSRG